MLNFWNKKFGKFLDQPSCCTSIFMSISFKHLRIFLPPRVLQKARNEERNNNNIFMTFITERNWFFITSNKFYFRIHNRVSSISSTASNFLCSPVFAHQEMWGGLVLGAMSRVFGCRSTSGFVQQSNHTFKLKFNFLKISQSVIFLIKFIRTIITKKSA